MKYYLAKTDPETYSIDDLEKDKRTVWDGVHNFQAMNTIKAMEVGDRILIYHSMGKAAIVGLAEVVSSPREFNDGRPSWVADFAFLKKFDVPVTLKEIKDSSLFNNWSLIRQSRLSTMEVPDECIEWLRKKNIL